MIANSNVNLDDLMIFSEKLTSEKVARLYNN
ncbi:MAG: hypothetical protein ACJA0X_000512, partial [Cyclobacteriaceae bacterium]